MRLAILIFAVFFGGTDAVQTLSALQGSFTSPNYPNEYANNLDNEWVIRVREGHHVKLRFTSFELEDSYEEGQGPCIYDYALITEGTRTIGRFCGNPTEYPWDAPRPNEYFYSKGNEMHLRFVTDYSNGDISPAGFEAHYVEEDDDECLEQSRKANSMLEDWDEYVYCNHFCQNVPGSFYCTCRHGFRLHENMKTCVAVDNCENQVLTDDDGVIDSPDYPHPYAKLSHCTWDIQVRRGLTVTLQFDDEFGVEKHVDEGCVYDILTVTAKGVTKPPYCGQTAPGGGAVMDMNTKDVRIEFKTDLAVEDKGFRITYNTTRIRCETALTNPANGEILNPKAYYEFENEVNFHCVIGYRLIGAPKLTCQWDGTWDHVQPHCEIKSCGVPDDLLDVSYSHILHYDSKHFKYSETLTVECNDWYYLDAGATEWICTDNEEWEKVAAPRAPNPPNDLPSCRPKCGMRLAPDDAVQGLISGGKKVKYEGGWPWMAFVDRGGGRSGKEYCGGTLIDEKTVVTAAHCTIDMDEDDEIHVWLGLLDRVNDNFNFTQEFVIPRSRMHEESTFRDRLTGGSQLSFDGDIAILKLDEPVELSYFVHPICVPSSRQHRTLVDTYLNDGMNAVVTGWGETERGSFSEDLLKTRMPFANIDTCRLRYGAIFPDDTDLITENMFCAGIDSGKNDACKGDSGGPLMTRVGKGQTAIWYLNGIVSFGDESKNGLCGQSNAYGVYTDVSKYEEFIQFWREK